MVRDAARPQGPGAERALHPRLRLRWWQVERIAQRAAYVRRMCRNIHTLHNVDPATTDDEIRAAALQYVRKVSGSTRPSQANRDAFERAVDEIAHATAHLLEDLVTTAPPKDRESMAAKRRALAAQRFGPA
jgi:hypothetical protein